MRLVILLCAGRAAAFKSFSYKRESVAASTLRELASRLPAVDFERSCYERVPVAKDVAAVFGVKPGTKIPMNTRLGPSEEHQDREESGEGVGLVQMLYLESSGPPSYFVLVDVETKKEYRALIKADLAISFNNNKYLHRVDASEDSGRKLLGPTTMIGGVFMSVGGMFSPLPACPDLDLNEGLQCAQGSDACGVEQTCAAPDCNSRGDFWIGQGVDPIWMDSVHCSGDEDELWKCVSKAGASTTVSTQKTRASCATRRPSRCRRRHKRREDLGPARPAGKDAVARYPPPPPSPLLSRHTHRI